MNLIGKLLKSKTVIVNSLTVIAGVIGYLAGNEVIAQNPEWVSALVAVGGALNVVLRLVTDKSVFAK